MKKSYKRYGHGGETETIDLTQQMREAKEVIGAEKWNKMSNDDKVKLTEYLIMKGEVEGNDDDYEYADGGMFEKPIGMMKEVKGRPVGEVVVSQKVYKSEIDEFIDYVEGFYGKKGIYADDLNGGFTKAEIKKAVMQYLSDLEKQKTWGGGDSLDRERVREILQPGYSILSKGAKVAKAQTANKELIKRMLNRAEVLLMNHISMGGTLDYSDKEYGYLQDEIDQVLVGYLDDKRADSEYAENLREEGFKLTAREAYDILNHRIDSIEEELDDNFKTTKMAKGKKPRVIHTQFEEEEFEYAKGGSVNEGDLVWIVENSERIGIGRYDIMSVEPLSVSTYKTQLSHFKRSDNWIQVQDSSDIKVFISADTKSRTRFIKKYVYADGGSVNEEEQAFLRNEVAYDPDRKKFVSITSFVEKEINHMGIGELVTYLGLDDTEELSDRKIREMAIKKRKKEYEDGSLTDLSKIKYAHGGSIFRSDDVEKRKSPSVSATAFEVGTKRLGNDGNVWEIVKDKRGVQRWRMSGKTYANGGFAGSNRKKTLEERAMESIGTSNWFQLDRETQAGVVAELLSLGLLPQRMDKGAKVSKAGKDFTVTYELMDGKKVVESYDSQELMDEGIANFYIMNDVKDAIVGKKEEPAVVEVKEEKKEEKPKRKGLFDVEKATTKVSKSKEAPPVVHVDGLEKEISRYDELKAIIKNAEAEKDIIGGIIRDLAREKFLDLYEKQGKRPVTITLESEGTEINFTVLDKYKTVTPEKESVLKEYDGLLGTDYTFTFDNEILDKEGKNGEKIADIVGDLIQNSEDIPDQYKDKLVKITKKIGVKKGTIERLLTYDNPAEILQIIEATEQLK